VRAVARNLLVFSSPVDTGGGGGQHLNDSTCSAGDGAAIKPSRLLLPVLIHKTNTIHSLQVVAFCWLSEWGRLFGFGLVFCLFGAGRNAKRTLNAATRCV